MKLNRLILAFVLMLAAFDKADAQLHIYKNDFTPAVVAFDSVFSFDAIIRNENGGSTYVAPLQLAYSINGVLQPVDSTSGLTYNNSGALVVLPAGDSLARTIVVNVTSPRFVSGPSVVVIWPISTSSNFPTDSLVLNIFVTPSSGISIWDGDVVKIYTSVNDLILEPDSGIVLKQVRIFDVMGQQVLNNINPSNSMPLPPVSKGIYFAEIIYNENKRKVRSFYH